VNGRELPPLPIPGLSLSARNDSALGPRAAEPAEGPPIYSVPCINPPARR